MDENRRLKQLTAALPRRLKPRAKSLLVTVWGDAVAPHGAGIWLGSLIRLVAPLGLNERLVRTSVLRLAREGWFTVAREGRRSYYGLTEFGHKALVAEPPRRIYAAAPTPWDGAWHLVLTGLGPDRIDRETRLSLRRELTWLGFGAVAPGVFAHPSPDRAGVERVLAKLGIAGRVELMTASPEPASSERSRDLLQSCWDLEALGAAYRRFVERFRPLWHVLEKSSDPDPETCFALRVLLIHEYRRIILRDPELPAELLSPDWAGTSARVLCRNLYRRVAASAERHAISVLETADGPLPEPRPYYFQRFGGLADAAALRPTE